MFGTKKVVIKVINTTKKNDMANLMDPKDHINIGIPLKGSAQIIDKKI
jgi:hypothetical protein